jgi:hypothetical protein
MRRVALVAALIATVPMAGCLGSVDAAEISQSSLDDNNWQQTSRSEESVGGGLGQLVTINYEPSNPVNENIDATGAIVATANDVPILDEERFIPDAIEKVEQQRNIDLEKTGTTTIDLVNLDTDIQGDVYKFEKQGAEGKAVLFTLNQCDPFVVTVGFGVTGGGGFGVEKTYEEAKNIVRGVQC